MSNDESPCLTRLVYGDDSELLVARWSDLRRRLINSLATVTTTTARTPQLELRECLLDFATEQVRAWPRLPHANHGVLP